MTSQFAWIIPLFVAGLHPPHTRPVPVAAPPYSAAVFAPGVISTRDYERDGTFTPDGRTFYFTKRTIWPGFSTICVSYLKNGKWTTPAVAPFSGQYADLTPFVSADGSRLYFASHRPAEGVSSPGYAIWVVERHGAAWSAPRRLPASINGHGTVTSPVETRNGSLYFIRGDEPHLFVATRRGDEWNDPAPVGGPSTPGSYELSAYVDPDERYLIVSIVGLTDALTTAEGVYERADLYVRERTAAGWSPLRHLDPPINSAAEEGSPVVSPDGRFLYFTSERGAFTEHGAAYDYDHLERALHAPGNGLGDIYRVDLRAIGLAK